jgi:hypothetical protein
MSIFNKRSSSGLFIPLNGRYVEYNSPKGNGSFVDIVAALGYHPDQVYWPAIFESREKIHTITFEVFTRNIVFIATEKSKTYISEKDIKKFLGNFSVTKQFTILEIEDILNKGVSNASLTTDFLARVLKLDNIAKNGFFYSEKIKTYLYFTDGKLSNFQSDDGLFPYARHLKQVNKTVFNWLAELAYKYWPNNDFQAQKEINLQCEAWANIPDAFGNEFIPLHRTENGGANLHMIRVCHYEYPISLSEFKEVNHGRFQQFESENEINIFKCGNFIYCFDIESERLITFKQL